MRGVLAVVLGLALQLVSGVAGVLAQGQPLALNETAPATLDGPAARAEYTVVVAERCLCAVQARRTEGSAPFVVEVYDAAGNFVTGSALLPGTDLLELVPLVLLPGEPLRLQFALFDVLGDTPVTTARVALEVRVVPAVVRPLVLEAQAQGVLTGDAPSALYSFAGQPGDVVRLDLTVGDVEDFPLNVVLLDPTGAVLEGASTFGVAEATLDTVVLAQAGAHLVVVSAFNVVEVAFEGTLNSFTLALSRAALPLLALGQPTQGTVTTEPGQLFQFEGVAGQRVRVTVSSADGVLAPLLEVGLLGAPDEPLAVGYVTTPGDISVVLTLPVNGAYVVRVRPVFPPDGGAAGAAFTVVVDGQ